MNLFYGKLSLQSDNKHFQSDSFITAWYEPETPFGDLSLKRKLQEKFVRIERIFNHVFEHHNYHDNVILRLS